MLLSAQSAYRSAVDGLRSVRVPWAREAASWAFVSAAQSLRSGFTRTGDRLIPLEGAYAELRAASHALPGFQMISFDKGCCAVHR
jgi:hypothetical protein